jgi:2-oxoisovalerate dehydrogenase E1 component
MSAVALAQALDRQRDVIHSNHRCHGHYLAWTDDVEGLIAEVMGKRTGVCGGRGGSQHLCAPGFFSNGIQGGIVPVSAGLAFAAKLAGHGGIVAVCIGDGTLGEGVIYETFNIAVKWRLPLLIVLENNLYAQSTSQVETLAGDILARTAAFGMHTFHGDTWSDVALVQLMRDAVEHVRTQCMPAFVRVDTYRLAAHSKGDDDRDPGELAEYANRDRISNFLREAGSSTDQQLIEIRGRIRHAVESAEAESSLTLQLEDTNPDPIQNLPAVPEQATQLESINAALGAWLESDATVILLGEDIRSPYGGAFKATRGLSDRFPDRVLNTPISEAAIVGVGNGLGLGGRRPVVEIMFGDFLTLCFDQLANHAAKFRGMYNGRVTNPLVVRTPMGGGRGYGPTHSQNLEKHLVGVPGLRVLVLHGRARVSRMYHAIRTFGDPLLIIENKLLYRARHDAPLPNGYSLQEQEGLFPISALRPPGTPDLTVVAFGRMSVLAEEAAAQLLREEVLVDLLFPLQVSPFAAEAVVESVSRTGKLLVVEEGAAGFDLGSEVIAQICVQHRAHVPLRCRRIAAQPTPIPSALELEQQVLPGTAAIVRDCLELFDA